MAEKHFNRAQQYIYPALPSHVLSRFYYERSYIEIEQDQYERSKLSYQNAENLFNSNQDYSRAFISISLGRTYDLAHVEQGSLLSIQQAQKKHSNLHKKSNTQKWRTSTLSLAFPTGTITKPFSALILN